MDTTTPTPLAEEMERRRVQLGLEWEGIAARAGLSTTFLRRFRRGGTGARALTKAKLEDALQWKRGSIDAIAAGGKPTLVVPADHPVPTLGEILVERGLARPEDLTFVEDVRDPGILKVLSLDLPDDTRDAFLIEYMQMRRDAFKGYLP